MRIFSGKFIRGIRVAKVVALAMIAAPEPISTIVGLGMLGVLTPPELVIKYQEAQKKRHLRHILKEYLYSYRPFGYGMGYTAKTSSSLSYRIPEPIYNKNKTYIVKKKHNQLNPISATGGKKVIYHNLNPRFVTMRYVETGGTRAGFVGYWGSSNKDRSRQVDPTLFKTRIQLNSF